MLTWKQQWNTTQRALVQCICSTSTVGLMATMSRLSLIQVCLMLWTCCELAVIGQLRKKFTDYSGMIINDNSVPGFNYCTLTLHRKAMNSCCYFSRCSDNHNVWSVCRTMQYHAAGGHTVGGCGKGRWHPANHWSRSHGSDTDRKGLPCLIFQHPWGTAHGHVARAGHVEEASGE